MKLSYEHRRDELDALIRSGSIGCPFAKEAAAQGEIRYAASPHSIDVRRPPFAYIEAITAFARDKTANILIALPAEDSPTTKKDCDAYAKLLYPETVSAMQFATQQVLDTVFAENPEDDGDLYELLAMNPAQTRPHIFRNWAHFDHMLTNMPTDSSLLRRKNGKLEQMFPFVMDPSYEPINGRQHPRWSPHFALIVNYRSDLQNLNITKPHEHAMTKRWQESVVGHAYVQGYRIPQEPEQRATKEKAAWRPND